MHLLQYFKHKSILKKRKRRIMFTVQIFSQSQCVIVTSLSLKKRRGSAKHPGEKDQVRARSRVTSDICVKSD